MEGYSNYAEAKPQHSIPEEPVSLKPSKNGWCDPVVQVADYTSKWRFSNRFECSYPGVQ